MYVCVYVAPNVGNFRMLLSSLVVMVGADVSSAAWPDKCCSGGGGEHSAAKLGSFFVVTWQFLLLEEPDLLSTESCWLQSTSSE